MRSDLQKRVSNAVPTPTFEAEDVRQRAGRRHLRRRVAAAVVAFVIAGGGGGGLFLSFRLGGSELTLPAAQIDGVIRQAYLPITDLSEWTVDQQRTMHKAESLLQSRCMRRAGFEVPSVPFDPFSVDRRYGLKDLEAARKWGYDIPPVAADPTQAYFDSLSPEERRRFELAAFGGPDDQVSFGNGSSGPGGCVGEARDTIFGSRRNSVRAEQLRQLFEALGAEAYFASEGGRVRLVKDAWIECMEERGYDVSNLDDPMDASVLATGPEGGPADIELAVSVVRCNDATDLVEVWSGVEAEIQAGLLEEHRAEMQEFLTLREHAYENARQIVGG